MQTQELLEVASLLASNAKWLVTKPTRLNEQSIVDYWVASRCRFDCWGHDLRTYQLAAERTAELLFTPRLYRLAVEIEVGELLARTLAAMCWSHDTHHARHDSSPITTNVLTVQRENTRRLNQVIVQREASSFREVVRFRNLRSRLQAFSDELVACFMPYAQVSPFAHDPRRIASLGSQAQSRHARKEEPLDKSALSGKLGSFRQECGEIGPNREETRRVAAAAMGFFDPEMFDSYGLLRTTWLQRLQRVEGESSELLADLLQTDRDSLGPAGNRIARQLEP